MEIQFLAPHQALWVLPFALLILIKFLFVAAKERRIRESAKLFRHNLIRPFAVFLLLLVALSAVAAIAARPVAVVLEPSGARKEAAMVCLFDATESMAAEPESGGKNRLERAKEICRMLVSSLPDVHVGVFAFTDALLPIVPVEGDRGAIAVALDDALYVGAVPVMRAIPGKPFQPRIISTFAWAKSKAAALMFPEKSQRNILVVFSDGEVTTNDYGRLSLFAAKLREQDITLFLVGVGERGERIPEIKDGRRTGAYVSHHPAIDEEFLSLFARLSGGTYLFEQEAHRMVSAIQKTLADVPQSDAIERTVLIDLTWRFSFVAALSVFGIALLRFGAGMPPLPGLRLIRVVRTKVPFMKKQ